MWFFDFPEWRWRWEDMCGPDGLVIWSPELHDLGLCFEQIYLEIPVLALLAVTSAYYSGRHDGYVTRGKLQMRAIKFRCVVVFLLTLLPVLQTYIDVSKSKNPVTYISFFLAAIQCLTWLIHLAYVSALRGRLGVSSRGPVQICVLWTLYAVLTVISMHSHLLISQNSEYNFSSIFAFRCSIARVVLQCCYAISLVPSQGNTEGVRYQSRYVQIGEQSPLLGNNAFNRFHEEEDPFYLGVAMEETTFLSQLLFYWVNPLVRKGAEHRLNHPDDLYDLPVDLSCGTVSLKLDKALIGNVDQQLKKLEQTASTSTRVYSSIESSPEISFSNIKKHNVSLLRALHKCFWLQFYSIGILKFASDCTGFAGPLLLNRLVHFIEDKNENIEWGYLYAAGLFLTTLIGAFCNSHFNFLMSLVGLKIRSSIVTAVYRKTLTVGGTVLNSAFNIGEIVNFMSTDTDRIVNACPSFHALWSIPFQLVITLYLLFQQVGLAFLAGVGFSILLIPINKFIAGKIGELSTKMMAQKDDRVKMMTEVLRGIRTIKLHVWETHFIRIITKQRAGELRYLRGRKYLDALCVYFWATTPVLISILTFGSYVLMGNTELTAATVFTTMALLNMLIGPLNAFPWVLNGVTEAWVSIKRVQRLLDLPDLDLDEYYGNNLIDDDPETHVLISNGHFNWGKSLNAKDVIVKSSVQARNIRDKGKRKKSIKDEAGDTSENIEEDNNGTERQEFYLSGINLNVKRGQFIGVIGQVGSGKSSLLSGILAELVKVNGTVSVADLELGFGFVTQQPWLQRGTLRDNILFGKAYDDTRYRTVLYACCLADDIHLLPSGDLTGVGEGGVTLSGGQKARVALARAVYQDKPIYLLDDIMSAVDRAVARHIFQHCIVNLLANKTRILCTHQTQYLINADYLLVMQNGCIVQEGEPSEVLQDFEDYFLPTDLDLSLNLSDSKLTDTLSSDSIRVDKLDRGSILNEEGREMGSVQMEVYGSYWKAVGHMLSISILIAMFLMQTSRNMTDWWLSYWVSHSASLNTTNITTPNLTTNVLYLTSKNDTNDNNLTYYMTIYGLFVGANTLFTLFRAFLFAYGGITAATKIHKTLLKNIMKAKVTFFDISPLGRILNRFSSDTYTIDDSLPFIMNIFFAQIFATIGAVVITIYGLPWLCLVLAPLVPIYHWLQHHYRLTSRELKRLSSVTLSPVYSHFNETLQGLATIRALRATQRFKRDNEDNVEANQKAQFASFAAAQWLGLRLQFIGVAMVTGVGMIGVIKHQFDEVDPGLVGLAISYALGITSLLSGVVNSFTETEREMIAVERVNQYIEEVESEKNIVVIDPPYAWPSQGVVSFNHVVMKYREHMPPSLKGVTFETRPAEKIGVVGRTGAGKSSLLAALFRMVELYSGTIILDNVNVAHISLNALRSRLSIIPQDPFLFSGTVRENLDPLSEFRDPELWHALTRVDMAPAIRRLGGLDAMFSTGGSNLSAGQRQLICLARAVLHNAKILCIDEATANVDKETDRQIQQTLRSAFHKSTVITIAHRVQTVLDYDRVMVMADGQVLEFDNPNELLSNPDSLFYQLVNPDSRIESN